LVLQKNIEDLMRRVGLEARFGELGIKEFDLIIKHGFNPGRVKNNPRKLTEKALRDILERLK
jgi:alcohol dehydrogenase class IV